MRKDLLHHGHSELSYEIREIVQFAKKIEKAWIKITWENIWDPVAKWEKIPNWLKDIVIKASNNDEVYWYSPTRWLDRTLDYLSENNNNINKDNILFFNGLWDAINKVYKSLAFDARVIWPNPAYSTHSSAEAAHAWSEHITYSLDPKNEWNPDLEELENKIKFNPSIVWILVVNPDNPTWAVFKKDVLEKIILLAKDYDLFVIFDEIYEKLIFDSSDRVLLCDIIWEVPWISMKGISKEVPWPWSRCGWIEVYNQDKDNNFSKYVNSILSSKMLEVCSTTLPQSVIPEIYESIEFKKHLDFRIKKYKNRADIAYEILKDIDCIDIIKPKWAFYLSVVFDLEKINKNFSPKYKNQEISYLVWDKLQWNTRYDKQFCYNILASKWICIVPLSSFNSTYDWFRMTLLEDDIEKYKATLYEIKKYIEKIS